MAVMKLPTEHDPLQRELSELRESRAMLEALVESLPDHVIRTDLDGTMLWVNRVAPGFRREEVLGRAIYEFTVQPDEVRKTLEVVRRTGEPRDLTTRTGAFGDTRVFYTRVGAIKHAGEVVGFTVASTDITTITATSRALADREHRLELAAAAADIGFWTWDARTDTVLWDPVTCRHFGIPPEAGKTTYKGFLERVHPHDRERVRADVDRSMERGSYAGLLFRIDLGEQGERVLMTSGRVERDEVGAIVGLTGCILDVTERQRLEEMVQQTQRMEAVGRLAAGVAHNFNNLLAAILPAIELTTLRFPESTELLGDVREAAERAADVVRQLMAFAGGSGSRTAARTCEVVAVARRVVQLARAVLDRQIELELEVSEPELHAAVDAGDLEQALLNLLLNARDAFAIAPSVTPRVRVDVTSSSRSIEIAVADNGPGMPEDVRKRAVEPFFTTKPAGRGTGLGLSSVYAMARTAGGELRVDSAEGRGTTVHLELPRAVAKDAPERTPPTTTDRGRGETVLLVDDEVAVRRALSRLLALAGYRVVDFGAPDLALARFAADPGEFDLVILDESMPVMSGSQLLERMRAVAPNVRVLSYSGLDQPMTGARAHLRKPVSGDRLLATMRTILHGR